jgi:cyclophilin family peptidyl-prolyl cis-trans isomerase/HEAT repeat protein
MAANIKLWISVCSYTLLMTSCSTRPVEPVESEAPNAFSDPTVVEIYDAADRRDIDALTPFATHDIAAYRMAYARCMASVLHPTGAETIGKLLSDPIPYVRLHASFAAGQYRDTLMLLHLEGAIKKASIPEIKAELLEAIGKCATPNAMNFLIMHTPSTATEEAGKMWGIYHAAIKGLLEKDHLRIVVAHIASGEEETRLAAAQILGRQNTFTLDEHIIEIAKVAKSDPSDEVRLASTIALRHCKNRDETLISIAGSDPDPRVRAAAISAFESPDTHHGLAAISTALEDGSPWVAMSAAKRMNEIYNPSFPAEISSIALTTQVPEVKGAIIAKLIQTNSEDGWRRYNELLLRGPSSNEWAVVLLSLAKTESALDTLLHYSEMDVPLSSAAASAICTGAVIFPSWGKSFRNLALKAFNSKNLSQCGIFAEAMTPTLAGNDAAEISKAMEKAAIDFDTPGTIEIKSALLSAAALLQDTIYKAEAPAYNHPIDWELVKSVSRETTVKIYTKAGTIELLLLIEDAPGSVANFITLAEAKFYDGLSFHRIVPGFVTQGGCPQGDGYGSTPYSIRSEFSPLQYGTGVAGLASSGKDTEGSQWFLTHAPAPHLNGRYTIFGAITDGFETLTMIHTGMLIDSVRVQR